MIQNQRIKEDFEHNEKYAWVFVITISTISQINLNIKFILEIYEKREKKKV